MATITEFERSHRAAAAETVLNLERHHFRLRGLYSSTTLLGGDDGTGGTSPTAGPGTSSPTDESDEESEVTEDECMSDMDCLGTCDASEEGECAHHANGSCTVKASQCLSSMTRGNYCECSTLQSNCCLLNVQSSLSAVPF